MNYPAPRGEVSKISPTATSVSPLEHARGAPGGEYVFVFCSSDEQNKKTEPLKSPQRGEVLNPTE